MNKTVRRTMLLVAAVIFFSITPFVVLYAIGYRLKAGDIGPTSVGVLFVESIPKKAAIDINDTYVGRTPRVVPNLVPGTVKARISLDGYTSWEKNVNVEPTMATEFRNIRLFPLAPKKVTIEKNVQTFALSPNRALVAIVDQSNRVFIINQDEKPVVMPQKIAKPVIGISWSPDSSTVLVRTASAIELIAVSNGSSKTIPVTPYDINNAIQWDPRTPGRLFELTVKNELRAIPASLSDATLIDSQITAYAVSNKAIYAVTINGDLQSYTLQGEAQDVLLKRINQPVERILIGADDQVVLLFKNHELGVLKNGKLEKITDNALSVDWSPDGTILYIQTAPSELYVYNVSNERVAGIPLEKLHLVSRLSSTISHIAWYAGGNHLVYQINDEIIITEIDTRDHPISYSLDSTNTGNALAQVGQDGDSMYYIKVNGKDRELVRASLLVE